MLCRYVEKLWFLYWVIGFDFELISEEAYKLYETYFLLNYSEEAQEYINIGAINSLFVLGRSVGFIGHYMDQKRLKQGLYRHPWDDISYVIPEQYN